jgi:integrase/recombinase XerD
MSALRAALGDYLRIRRQLGFTMPQEGRLLEGFVGFAERAGAERITTSLALAWARIPVNVHPHTWRQRLIVLRGFARHLATIDPASEVPPADLLPGHRPRVTPFIYSGEEIAALLEAARRLRPTLRAARHQTLIGLLAVTGCRPGELLALDRQDVDLTHGRIHVRAGKCLRRPARRCLPEPVSSGVLPVRQGTADGPRRTEQDLHHAHRAGGAGGPRLAAPPAPV